MKGSTADKLRAYLRAHRDEMLAFLEALVRAESPSTVPESQTLPLNLMSESLQTLGFQVQRVPGVKTGGGLLGRWPVGDQGEPGQLLLGHCDTVWPLGTLEEMPFVVEGNVARGPGIYDMKAGLTQLIFALQALVALDLHPDRSVVVFVNSDEEIGSIESKERIQALAQQVERVFVLEPALGEDGRLKTARKGVGTFYLNVEGRAAHAGLDPQKGASAIVELAHQIQQLSALTDLTRGVTVNVGVVAGGVGANVIAPSSSAVVDVRVPTAAVAAEVSAAVRGLRAVTPGTSVTIKGAINRPPLEQTPANRTLWRLAQSTAASLDLHLEEGMAGGGSDGNFTSQYAATLDGLGAVGDGAHALHEFIYLDKMVERAALLALLLLAPPLGES